LAAAAATPVYLSAASVVSADSFTMKVEPHH
jgi:hypothetical protein